MRAMDEWAVRNNRRLLPPVCDINKSGRTFRKRSVDKIIAAIKDGHYRHVVLWKWSRWARNQAESAVYSSYVHSAGGRVDSATEDFDLDTAIGRLGQGMTGVIDQYQSELISESWSSVHALRREDGLPHGGRERFGYAYGETVVNEERRKRYTKNDEAPILIKAYCDWLDGKSFIKIAQELNAATFVTMLGGRWTPQGVARMMDTGFAAGLIRERSEGMKEKIRGKQVGANSILSYDIWRTGSHEAVIEASIWDTYKARRVAASGLPPRSKAPVHALSAIMFCTECRRRLTTKYAGAGRTHQWQCPWQKSFHPGVAVTVNNRLALVAVREWVRAEIGDELPVAKATNTAREEQAKRLADAQTHRRALSNRIGELEGMINNLTIQIATSSPSVAARFISSIEVWDSEIDQLRAELARSAPRPRAQKDQEALRALDAVWGELPPSVLHEALAKVISRVEVSPRSEISTRASAADRVSAIGVWEDPSTDEWLASRPA